jgi:hypothetical protein
MLMTFNLSLLEFLADAQLESLPPLIFQSQKAAGDRPPFQGLLFNLLNFLNQI